MKSVFKLGVATVSLLMLVGCPSEDDGNDAGQPMDAMSTDMGFVDPPDTGPDPVDTGPDIPDVGPVDDVGVDVPDMPDTGEVADTGEVEDTGVDMMDAELDAGVVPDADPPDMGVVDGGVVCPAPGLPANPSPLTSFFVTSVGNDMSAGDYGGLAGADYRCQCLAAAVGLGNATWAAYLSTAPIGGQGATVNARDRIGNGPWFNYDGQLIADNLGSLHTNPPDSALMLDEYGRAIPNAERDILTGSNEDGTARVEFPGVPGSPAPTCSNWTSDNGGRFAWVGRANHNAPGVSPGSWNSDHGAPCNQAGLNVLGGNARLYCFATTPIVGTDGGVPDGGAPDAGQVVALSASANNVTVNEGQTATFDVRLTAQPTSNVFVSLGTSDRGAATVTPTNLIFTPVNWNTPQNVVITGLVDADMNNESVAITLAAAGLQQVVVSVTVLEPGAQSIIASPTNLNLTEGGGAAVAVTLNAAPTGNVTVTAVSSAPMVALAAPTAVTFTPANWNVPQTIMVTAPQDADTADGAATITLSSAGLTDVPITVTVTDDDAQRILTNMASLNVVEGGTAQFAVTLQQAPTANLTVTIASSDPAVAANPTVLTFTPANFAIPQNVTVTGNQDADVMNETAVITLSSVGVGAEMVTVTVVDDDAQGIVVDMNAVAVLEGGVATVGVRLSSAPTGIVTVAAVSSDPGAATAAPATLNFTAGNFAIPQQLTIAGINDVDLMNENVTVTLTSAGLAAQTITVAVMDDDMQNIVVDSNAVNLIEGTIGTFSVSLAQPPTGPINVGVVSSDAGAAALGVATLTFTPANWNVPQAVMVTALQDVDTTDEVVTVTLTAAGVPPVIVAVNVTDDDQQRITVDNANVTVVEGGSQVVRVSLLQAPAGNVAVSVASSDPASATAAPATLIFSAANFSIPQPITISAPQDGDTANDAAVITLTAAGLTPVTVNVTVTDDDQGQIVAAPATLTVAEGGTVQLSLSLAAPPQGTLTVNIGSSNPGAATANPPWANFTAANFNQPQQITIAGIDDADTTNDMANITLAAVGLADVNVPVTVTDDDAQGIRPSVTNLSVPEGDSGSFGVTLAFQPANNITVNVVSSAPGSATVMPATITFTPGNFNTPQQVIVTGVEDNDLTDDNATVMLTGPGLPAASVAVAVPDNDMQRLVTSLETLSILEGQTNSDLTVALAFAPQANLTVSVVSSDPAATVTPNTLTFTAANFANPQPLTVTTAQDANTTNETLDVILSAPGVPNAIVGTTIIDDDALGIFADRSTIAVNEGATDTIMVRLTAAPAGNLTVNAATSDQTAVTLNQTALTFTPANFATPQAIVVTAADDTMLADRMANITLTAPGAAQVTIPVTVNNIDVQAVQLAPPNLTIAEGAVGNINVSLAFQPVANVTFTVVSSDPGAGTVTPATLTFTPQNFGTPQAVMVTGVADADVTAERFTVRIDGPATAVATVDVTDDDQQMIVANPANLTVSESGTSILNVSLAFAPPADTTIQITSSDLGALFIEPVAVTFTPQNFATPQQIAFRGVADDDLADENVMATLTAPGLANVVVPVTVTDDDRQAIVPAAAAVGVIEEGTATLGISLAFRPAGNVNVMVASSDPGVATVTPAMLTFTAANFMTPQNVTLTGIADDMDTVNDMANLLLTSPGLDNVMVPITVTDNDQQGIFASAAAVAVNEGAMATVMVNLVTQPVAPFNVTVASSDPASVTVTPATLTFTAANFNMPQAVTIAGIADDDITNDAATVTLTGAGVPNVPIAVTVNDDDTQSVVVSQTAVTVNEGANGSIGVTMAFRPAANIVIPVISSDPGSVTAIPAQLTFTPQNFATPQPVTFTGVDDLDTVDDSAQVLITTAGLPNTVVAVTVNDDDTQAIVPGAAALTIAEGAAGTLDVRLAFQPAGNTNITVASSNPAAIQVAPATLTFTPANFATPQQVTLTAQQDVDTADGAAVITLSSPGLPNATTAITVTDDDTQAIVSSVANIGVVETQNGNFGVNLAFQPAGNVVVNVASSNPAGATVAPAQLTFTPANYQNAQMVTVTGADDVDTVNANANVVLTSPGLDQVTVAVTVTDDDALGISVDNRMVTVAEGAAVTVAVQLAAAPQANTNVTVMSSNPAAATAAPATLTFTPQNFNTPQNVTIVGVQDANTTDGAANITLSAPGVPNVQIGVTVTDDDTQAIVASTQMLAVQEGGTAQIGVNLAFQPAVNVVVTVASSDAVSASAAPGTLTFTPQNFAMPQQVTVVGVDDNDVVGDTANVTLSAPGLANSVIAVAVADDDTQAIVIGNNAVTVGEGAMQNIPVNLAFAPAGDVTVTIASSDPASATVNPATLRFTPANFAVPQNFTLTGVTDVDLADEMATITLSAPGLANQAIAATVTDDDTQAIVVSSMTVGAVEGQTGTFDVNLAFQPAANVVVAVASGDLNVMNVAPAMLTFTPANFATPQTVTVTGVMDQDTIDNNADITLSTPGVPNVVVAGTVTDDDAQRIFATATTLTVQEGATGTVDVRLSNQPQGNVVVAVNSSDPASAAVAPATLTFNAQNFATPQTITVTGPQDDDVIGDAATITLTAAGLANVTIAVTVNDDDTQAIVTSAATVNVNEGGTGQVGVNLAFRPQANVNVMVASSDPVSATVMPAMLTFTPQNFMNPQAVTITAPQDVDVINDAANINLTAMGLANVAVAVAVADDDTQAIVASANTITVDEGANGMIAVSLAFQPQNNVVVTVASSDPASATVNPGTLTFTPANFATAQQITVAGPQDVDTTDDTAIVTLSAAGLANVMAGVTVTDDDTQVFVLGTPTVNVVENNVVAVDVSLAFQPPANVVVGIASSNPAAATVMPATLTFTPMNFGVPQQLMINGVEDADAVNGAANVTLTAMGIADAVLPVTVTDNDQQGIFASATELTIQEGGVGTIAINLIAAPTGNLNVTVASSDAVSASVNPMVLTFTPANFMTPQAVTVVGEQDDDVTNDTANLTISTAGVDDVTVAVTVTDDDTQAIVADAMAVTVPEGGNGTVGVNLAFRPAGNVVVNVASSDPAAAAAAPATLTFTPQNFMVVQQVTIDGVNDADVTNDMAMLNLTSAGLAAVALPITVTDDDAQALVISDNQLVVDEGQTGQIGVNLAFQPAGNVMVTIMSDNPGSITAGPAQLTFTPANFATVQQVTIGGVDDVDLQGATGNVTIASAGLANQVIAVTVNDDDAQAIVADAATASVIEGGTATFGVNLAFQPAGNVMVAVGSSNPGSATVMPAMLTFTPQNFATPQQVTIAGIEDMDTMNEAAVITLSSGGLGDVTVDVTVTDNDAQSIFASTGAVTVGEGGTAQFGVNLVFAPAGNVDVMVASSDNAAATVAPAVLTFTPGNFATPQVVTVTGVDDADIVDDMAMAMLTSAGLAAVNVQIVVDDDDAQAIVADAANVTINEGGTGMVGVRLQAQPTANVQVTVTSQDPGAATVAPAMLTFTPANFATPQQVTITGAQDNDVAAETTALTLASNGLDNVNVQVNVNDDDTNAILLAQNMIGVAEGGAGTVGVSLMFQPTADVTVTVVSSDPAAATAAPQALIFTPANFGTQQQINVGGVEDADAVDESVIATLSSPGLTNVTFAIMVTDNDAQGIVASVNQITIMENGTGTFDVSLGAQPTGDVTVTLTSSDPAVATLNPQALTFTPANFMTPQTVTAQAPDDANTTQGNATVTIASAGLPNVMVAVTVTDDDVQRIIPATDTITVNEGGNGTFDVTLAFQPAANVNVTVVSSNPGVATANPPTLAFTPQNFATPQQVTVAGVEEPGVTNDNGTITLSGMGLADQTVAYTVIDNDTLNMMPMPSTLVVNEGGNTNFFTIVLTQQPPANIVVNLASSDPGAATVVPAMMTFTPQNWNNAQQATVAPINDADAVNEAVTITLTAAGLADVQVGVTVNEDDVQAIVTNQFVVNAIEGQGAQVGVQLQAQPLMDLVVAVTSDDPGAASSNPQTLTFTPANWNQLQVITINGVQDADLVDEVANLTLAAPNVPPVMVQANITDDDFQAIRVTNADVTVAEGGATTIGVTLAFMPQGNVTVNMQSDNVLAATLMPAALTFTPQNYNVAQTVTINGVQDLDVQNAQALLRLSSAGLIDVNVNVNVTDDDTQSIVASTNALMVAEGGNVVVNVSLAFQPAGPTNVMAVASDGGAAAPQPAVLTFFPGDFNVPQPLTIMGVEDVDLMNENLVLTLSTPNVADTTINVAVTDDDTETIVPSVQNLNVAEGGTANFGVTLMFQPATDVTVTLATANPGIATVMPNTLTFTPANFNQAQQVTVTGVEDINLADDPATINLTAPGAVGAMVAITATDNDMQTIVPAMPMLTVVEQDTNTLGVSLMFQPQGNVTVNAVSGDLTVTTVAPPMLIFTPANFNVPQNVTVTGLDDLDALDNNSSVDFTAPGAANVSVPVTVTDNDTQAIVTTLDNLTITEGQFAVFDVTLAAQPPGNVAVNLASANVGSLTVNPAVLNYNAGNFNQPQTVTVTGVQDANMTTDMVNVTLTSPGLQNQIVTVTVNDDDIQRILPSVPMLTVTEEQVGTFGVSLGTAPLGNVVVTVASSDPAGATVAPAMLTFTPANFNQQQIVNVTGTDDGDQDNEAITVTLSAAGVDDATVAVTVIDNDLQQIIASATDINVAEGGMALLNVNLSIPPPGNVNVAVASSNAAAAAAAPAMLTFTPANFNAPQAVTITAPQDGNQISEMVTVTLSSAGVADVPVNVNVQDDDQLTIVTSVNQLNVLEGGTATFTVNLGAQPMVNTDVTIMSSAPGSATVMPATLTFTPANFAMPQVVTVTGVQDVDTTNNAVNITADGAGLAPVIVMTTVVDDDGGQTIIAGSNALTVGESQTSMLAVSLATAPAVDFVVTVDSTDQGVLTVNPVALVFTAANFATPQNVTITTIADPDTVNGMANIILANPSPVVADVVVPVTVVDDDNQALVLDSMNVPVTEGQIGASFVNLAFQPQANVIVTVASSDPGAANPMPTLLTFTPNDWDLPQQVNVEGVQDVDLANEVAVLTYASAGLASVNVTVPVTDEDVQAIVASNNFFNITEGMTATVDIQLAFQPAMDVVVAIATSDANSATVDMPMLTFNALNWDQPQRVTITAEQDLNLVDQNVILTLSSMGVANVPLTVAVMDEDTQIILPAVDMVTIAEGGSVMVGVTTMFEPDFPLLVDVLPDDPNTITATPNTVTFTAANYNTPQMITINALQDPDTQDQNTRFVFSTPGLADAPVNVTVTDDDMLQFNLSANQFNLDEGNTEFLDVFLTAQPAGNVQVMVASSNPNAVTVDIAQLTFTPADFFLAQRITLTAVQDVNQTDEMATITLTAQGIPNGVANVTVIDDDMQRLVVDVNNLTVTEGLAGNINVSLANPPGGNVAVNIVSSDTNAATVLPATLNFNAANFNQPQAVAVQGVEDVDEMNEMLNVTISSAGVADVVVPVNVIDNDLQAIITSANMLTIPEGATATFGVNLTIAPMGNVDVTVASADNGAVTAMPQTLTFTPANFNQAQFVTVTGVDDGDSLDENVNVTLTSPGVADVTVMVTVADDDQLSILTDQTMLNVNEGGMVQVGVTLSLAPQGDVTVTIASAAPQAATAAPATLTFNAGNFDTPQPITITGVQDADTLNNNAVINLTAPNVMNAAVNVTVIDDDSLNAIVPSVSALQITEGGMATFTVRLQAMPQFDETIAIDSGDQFTLAVNPNGLLFTTMNWNVPQTVTVTALQDPDTVNNVAPVILTNPSPDFNDVNVTVTVADEDIQAIVPDLATINVMEDDFALLGVNLAFQPQPGQPVTVNVLSANPAIATVTPATLMFTDNDWDLPQDVTVNGVNDVDLATEMTNVILSASGVATMTLPTTVNDDDTQALVINNFLLNANEGTTQTFNVNLAFQPAADTVVTVTSPDLGAVLPIPSMLTFSPANYNLPQTVTVNAVEDVDLLDEAVDMTVATPGVMQEVVTMLVLDTDMQAVVPNVTAITVPEQGTAMMTVQLMFEPDAPTQVDFLPTDTTVFTVAPASFLFTTANWNMPVTLTLTGLDDPDTMDNMSTLNLDTAGVAPIVPVAVTSADNDAQSIIVNPAQVTVTEGLTAMFDVSLSQQPGANVTVNLVSNDTAVATISAAQLTFTPQNFNTPQAIVVTGVEDANTAVNMTTVTVSSAGLMNRTVNITANDNDTQAVVLSANALAIAEGGSGAVGVTLLQQPAGNVVVNVASSDVGATTVAPAMLTFTPANFNAPQQVMVNAVQDGDTANEMVNVTFSSGGLTNQVVNVTVTDDDVQQLVVSATNINVDEGATQNVMVNLSQQPQNNVVMTVGSSDQGAVTAAPATITFTPANFATPQAVMITGVVDADGINDMAVVNLIAPGIPQVNINVTVLEGGGGGMVMIVANPAALALNEGNAGQFAVSLSQAPAANVTITVTSNDVGAATIAPAMLTFTPANFGTGQNVTVTAVEDVDQNNENTTVTLSSAGLADVNVGLTITDNDVQGLQVTPLALNINEGATGTFTVNLAINPGANTNVTVTSADNGAVTVNPGTLTFTAANFGTPQTVTVTGVQDGDQNNENVNVTVASAVAPNQTVAVAVADDDAPMVNMSFFVTSRRVEVGGVPVTGGNFGGIAGADAFCLALAREADATDNRAWRAYLSTPTVNARDRIGAGPWFNAAGTQVAANVAGLHATPPATANILDEQGRAWDGGGSTRHDVLTGSNAAGNLATNADLTPPGFCQFPDGSFTYPNCPAGGGNDSASCQGWTTDGSGGGAPSDHALVGHLDHSDLAGGSASWSASHVTGCDIGNMNADLGDARIYCFVAN